MNELIETQINLLLKSKDILLQVIEIGNSKIEECKKAISDAGEKLVEVDGLIAKLKK